MKRSEKQMVFVLLVLAALVLVVRVVPWAVDYYQHGRDEIALLQERVERYRTLIVDTAQWQQKAQLKQAEVNDLQGWIFQGADANLVSSSLQRTLRQVMAENGVEVRETGVARYSYVGKWLMVEQDMSFTLGQQAMLPFLRALDAARPRLQISAMNISRNRRNYSGALTVVGFAKAPDRNSAPVAAGPRTSLPTVPAKPQGGPSAPNPFAAEAVTP